MKQYAVLLALFVCRFLPGWSQETDSELKNILDSAFCKVGVFALSSEGKVLISKNAGEHFPMQSVFKFPIAVVVLSMVDEKKLALDRKIKITRKELAANTWSPIKDLYPNGAELTIAEILGYTVSQSDNIGCDVLLKLVGGAEKVQNYLIEKGFTDISVVVNEADMHRDWKAQFRNWATPQAITRLLEATWNNTGELLTPESHTFLWKIMMETNTGPKRLKGLLPDDAKIGHKTGSSGQHKGITAATNDVGVIRLANGKVIFISVFVSESKEQDAVNEQIIAELAQLACNMVSQ